MKRDVVAPVRKAKHPITAATMNLDLRPRGRDFRYAPTSSGEFKFNFMGYGIARLSDHFPFSN